jgi:hypothetical protein
MISCLARADASVGLSFQATIYVDKYASRWSAAANQESVGYE